MKALRASETIRAMILAIEPICIGCPLLSLLDITVRIIKTTMGNAGKRINERYANDVQLVEPISLHKAFGITIPPRRPSGIETVNRSRTSMLITYLY